MEIKLAETDIEILSIYPVLKQLRPHLSEETFLSDVRRLQDESYRIAYLKNPDICAVAGYRLMEKFATGLILYVDDLVTTSEHRSKGYGKLLLDWLIKEAKNSGCRYLTLDSGLKRSGAHKFYRTHGLEEIAFHFAIPTDGGPQWTSN